MLLCGPKTIKYRPYDSILLIVTHSPYIIHDLSSPCIHHLRYAKTYRKRADTQAAE